MKITIPFLFAVLLNLYCTQAMEINVVTNNSTDSLITQFIGDTVSNILFNPTKVTLYFTKNRKKKNEEEIEIADGFIRDTLVKKLKPEELSILQFILLSDTLNYHKNSVQIKSPYMPLYEFVFTKKKKSVQVLISFSDNYWEIKRNNITVCKYNFVCREQLQRFINLLY